MKNVARRTACCALGLLLALCVVGCAAQETPPTVAEMLSLGEQYLLDLDYEKALVQFLGVIEAEPMNVRAYLGAAQAYVGLGQTDNAIGILEQGLAATGDSQIAAMLEALQSGNSSPGREQAGQDAVSDQRDHGYEVIEFAGAYAEPVENHFMGFIFYIDNPQNPQEAPTSVFMISDAFASGELILDYPWDPYPSHDEMISVDQAIERGLVKDLEFSGNSMRFSLGVVNYAFCYRYVAEWGDGICTWGTSRNEQSGTYRTITINTSTDSGTVAERPYEDSDWT